MKIPRYNSTLENPVGGSNRSLTTGTHASNTLAQIGVTAVNQVLAYGAKKNALTAKLRRLEINTNVANIDTTTTGNVNKFLSDIPNRNDYLTPDMWLNDFDKQAKVWEKSFVSSVDDQTWKEAKAVFWKNIFDNRLKISDKVTNQKVNNGVVAFDQSFITYSNKLETSTSIKEMQNHYKYQSDFILPKFDKLLMSKETYKTARLTIKSLADNKVMLLQANESGTVTLTNPQGEMELDWEQIAINLKNPEFEMQDINGRVISVDDTLRQSLIKDSVVKASNQKKYLENMRENKNIEDKKSLTNDLIEITKGTEKGNELAANFKTMVQNSDLKSTEKRALVNGFDSHLTGGGVKGWNTDTGKKANILLNTLIAHRVIDTETERGLLTEAFSSGLVEGSDYLSLNDRIDKNIKKKNAYKMPLYKNVISMLGTELGMKDVSKLLSDTDVTNMEDITMLLQNKFPKEVFDTLNYFNRLLAIGEKKGFTYDEMLSDTTSSNYLVDKVLAFSKAAKDGKISSDEQLELPIDFIKNNEGNLIDFDAPYTISYDMWFDGLTPVGDTRELPKRKDNETINAYFSRTMKELRKQNFNLPSVLTGYQFDEDLDLNTELIVPDITE
jgi:hypothetical protein